MLEFEGLRILLYLWGLCGVVGRLATMWTLSLTLWVRASSITHWGAVSPYLLPLEVLCRCDTQLGMVTELWSQQREQESTNKLQSSSNIMKGSLRCVPLGHKARVSEPSSSVVDWILKWLMTPDMILQTILWIHEIVDSSSLSSLFLPSQYRWDIIAKRET